MPSATSSYLVPGNRETAPVRRSVALSQCARHPAAVNQESRGRVVPRATIATRPISVERTLTRRAGEQFQKGIHCLPDRVNERSQSFDGSCHDEQQPRNAKKDGQR